MTTYIVDIETRKHDRDETLGPLSTFQKAQKASRYHLGITEEQWKSHTEYGSSFEKGIYNSEEISLQILERVEM